jgi:uncharacterized protein
MPAIIIPTDLLSPDTLQSVIEEFVSRSGTDYGEKEVPIDTKIRLVNYQLEVGIAVLVYDEETETCNIFNADDLVVNNLKCPDQ